MDRKLATGCALALLVFAIGVCCVVLVVPKLFRKGMAAVKHGLAEERRIVAFEKAWTPPSASPDASWFPKKVGMWRLTSQEPSVGIPRLNIERHGQYGAYRFGAEVVDVNVMAAKELEKEGLFDRARGAQSGVARMSMKWGNRASLRLNGDDYTRLWWMPKGWLFIFHGRGGDDPKGFMEPYLKAIDDASSATSQRQGAEPAPI